MVVGFFHLLHLCFRDKKKMLSLVLIAGSCMLLHSFASIKLM